MKFFNKYFFFGLGSGVLLTIVLSFGLIFLASYLLMGPSPKNNQDKKEVTLKPLERLNDRRTPAYEQHSTWAIRTLEGETVEFSQFRGKVVFFNIWATWCPPCVNEMPSIQDLYEQMKDEDVAFLIATREEKETVQKFLDKNQFSFPVYLVSGELPYSFRSKSIPATLILDREGVIAYKHIGSTDWNSEACQNFLRGLL